MNTHERLMWEIGDGRANNNGSHKTGLMWEIDSGHVSNQRSHNGHVVDPTNKAATEESLTMTLDAVDPDKVTTPETITVHTVRTVELPNPEVVVPILPDSPEPPLSPENIAAPEAAMPTAPINTKKSKQETTPNNNQDSKAAKPAAKPKRVRKAVNKNPSTPKRRKQTAPPMMVVPAGVASNDDDTESENESERRQPMTSIDVPYVDPMTAIRMPCVVFNTNPGSVSLQTLSCGPDDTVVLRVQELEKEVAELRDRNKWLESALVSQQTKFIQVAVQNVMENAHIRLQRDTAEERLRRGP
ncbi:hypothetical protein T484DRAFT_1756573 [Baffinella frigidus]|nr:hypothetical protein T484DRAFT_1756573 [Cryptophyta sp. CCMP2293]